MPKTASVVDQRSSLSNAEIMHAPENQFVVARIVDYFNLTVNPCERPGQKRSA